MFLKYKLMLMVAVLLVGCEKKPVKSIVVHKGDTVDTICEKYNINKSHLIKMNKLRYPYILEEGHVLHFTSIETSKKILSDDVHDDIIKIGDLLKNDKSNNSDTDQNDEHNEESNSEDTQSDSTNTKQVDSTASDSAVGENDRNQSKQIHSDQNSDNSSNLNDKKTDNEDADLAKIKPSFDIDSDLKKEIEEDLKNHDEILKSLEVKNEKGENADKSLQNSEKNNSKVIDNDKLNAANNVQNANKKIRFIFPVKNGEIDQSRPFSQGRDRKSRQDGVFILHSGDVIAAFDSEVAFVDQQNKTVYLKHGKYVMTYQNLDLIKVSKGDVVKIGSKIGECNKEIFIRLWNGNEYVNPENISFI